MKRITFPLRVGDTNAALTARMWAQVIASVLGIALLVRGNPASTVPQFGGTLRVQMSERVDTIDPRQWPSFSRQAFATERIDSLVFDRLVRLDMRGALQPALAISWLRDTQSRRWQFQLREGVKFSDGSALTPVNAAMALQQLLGVSYDVSASSDSVVIQADHPIPELLLQLAAGRYFVFHVAEDNAISGTGPFRVTEWPAAAGSTRAIFAASENCWAGRSFVDKIELQMGVDTQQQANAISFGQADVVEWATSEVRRAAQRGVRTVSSDPVELFALVIDASRSPLQNARLRQAISLAVDRASIADVILQKQGVSAGGLLPNWLSGYAHLFPVTSDLSRAKELMAASEHEFSHSKPLVLFYDSSDAEARAVADRVSVNLREVGVMVQVSEQTLGGKAKPGAADLRLVRHRIAAPDPAAALSELLNSLDETATDLNTPEQMYAAERAPIDAFRVIPLVHVSESYGLSPQVRDWMAPRWGGWNLADVWLGPPSESGGSSR